MLLVLLLICSQLLGCAADRDPRTLSGPTEELVLVLDTLLLVDLPLPPLFLRRNQSPDRPYCREAAGRRGAQLRILQGDAVFAYAADPGSAGFVVLPRPKE